MSRDVLPGRPQPGGEQRRRGTVPRWSLAPCWT